MSKIPVLLLSSFANDAAKKGIKMTARPLLLLLLLVAAVPISFAKEEDDGDRDEPDCGVYMAPSTLGVANLGIYTGKALQPGDVLPFPEIVVPLMFREWHHHGDSDDGSLWDRYIWEGPVVDLEPMKDLLDVDSSKPGFIPGVGCTINSRLDLKNIDSTSGSFYDTAGVLRSDPGAGAFSPYHSSKTTAVTFIEAGSEIFAEYGYEWIPDIPGAVVTTDENMDAADEFLQQYGEWYKDVKDQMPLDVAEGLWNLTTHFPTHSQVLDTLPPKPWKDVMDAVEHASTQESVVRKFLRQDGVRDLEWLKQHGRCQDHLKPGISTLPHAGRGAFASRNLPKGTIVGYSPLIHMGNNRQLWDIEYSDGKHDYVQQDLILNYSFGHRHSTLILTPYGAMVNFINHSKEKANVKIQWPQQESEAHKPEWLNKDLDFLIHTIDKIGLSFEYVALRDIKEGEEVFMDYGDEWQAAWDEHVCRWVPPADADTYKHSTEWKEPLLTLEEQAKTPYPSNLVTVCVESYSYNHVKDEYTWTPVVRNSTDRIFCDVLDRKSQGGGDYVYTVQYKYDKHKTIIVHNVPKEGVQLKDNLFTADWHMEQAFRHEIMIPDDMFPEKWKNRKEMRFHYPDGSTNDEL